MHKNYKIIFKALTLFLVSIYVNAEVNLLDPNNGAVITRPPSQYSSYYSYTRLNDLQTDKYWLSHSGVFVNNAIFKFDDLNTSKSFNVFKLYNHGGSPSIKSFAILSSRDMNLSQDIGKKGWVRAISDNNISKKTDMLSWIEGGVYQNTASQYSNSYPATRMNDSDYHNRWLSHTGVFVNNFDYKFDTNWDENSSERVNECSAFRVVGSSASWGLKDFQVEVKYAGDNNWTYLSVPNSAGDTNFNFLNEYETGVYQNTASQYSNSYPATRMNDSDYHNRWLSHTGVFVNNFDYKFDTDYDGNADNNITFDRFRVVGSSASWGLKDFQVEVKYAGDNNWTYLSVPNSAGDTNFNFLNEYETGVYQNTASQYSNSYPATRMNDSDYHNRWLSHTGVFVNNFDYKFDTDYDGNADNNITFDRFRVVGSSASWGLKDFQVEVKYAGDNNWTYLSVPNSAGDTNFNFLNEYETGVYQNTASQYSNSYPATRMNDSDYHNRWLSHTGVFVNNFDYKFDTDYDGNADNNITFDRFRVVGSSASWGLKDFQVFVSHDHGSSWQQVSINGNTTFTAQNTNTLQTFNLDSNLSNVTDVRFKTINNYGHGSYVGGKEFEVIGTNNKPIRTFTAQNTNALQTFNLDSNLSNVTDVRFKTINNYGHGSYVGGKEFEVIGTNNKPIRTFTAQNTNTLQTFNLDSNLSNVTDVRFKTINNYGHGSYVGGKEFEVIGTNNKPIRTFTAQNTNTLQTFNLDSNLSNVTDVRFKTINNYGHGSYVGGKEFEFMCKPAGGIHTFEALQTSNVQTFNFNYLNGSLFRFITLNNYGYGSYLGAREIELYLKGPIANYQFESCKYNGSDNEVIDSTGSYNGTSVNGVNTRYISSYDDMFGRAAVFDGHDSYIKLPNFPDITGSRTITAWFYTKDAGKPGQRIFADDEQNGNGNYALSIGDPGSGRARFYIRGLSPISLDSHNIIQSKHWYFAAATFDKDSMKKTLDIYDINGTLLDSVSQTVSGTVGTPSGTASIGGETDSGEVHNRFKGYIDKVLIFKSVLSSTQIEGIVQNNLHKKQYNGIDIPRYKICPVADYRLDDMCNSGGQSFYVAESAIGLVGVIKPDGDALKSKRAKVCTGAEFDGQKQYIDVNDSDILDNTKTLTTTAWIYPTQLRQTNGTNARGIFSKRNSYTGNSQYAYGVFFWNGHNMNNNEAALYVDIDTQNDRTHSNKKIKANEWTHIAIVFDGRLPKSERTKIYINGILDSVHSETSSAIPDYSSDFYIANLYTGSHELKVFKGIMDEVKIFDQALNDSDIKRIYDNENAGRDYTGQIRQCVCTSNDRNITFNAVDRYGGCYNWDNNIKTKIVNQNINLTILAKDSNGSAAKDANITKVELLDYGASCSNIKNKFTIWSGNALTDENGCFDLPVFQYSKSTKCAKIQIFGKTDTNETNATSTDNFAIRPKKFTLLPNAPFYAGDTFGITFKALDANDVNATDYNETKDVSFVIESNITKPGCFQGVLNVNGFSFQNGLANDVNATYSNLGDINITIKEKPGSEFAKVDSDDTNDTQRYITPGSVMIEVKPYDINITNVNYQNSTAKEWLYDANATDMNATVQATIKAYAKGSSTALADFNSTCYAKDMNISFSYDANYSDTNVSLDAVPIEGGLNLQDINHAYITLASLSFIGGEANASYAFNVKRERNHPLNPVKLSLKDINITTSDISKYQNDAISTGNINGDQNSTFYYGKIYVQDFQTTEQNTTSGFYIDVYCNGCQDSINGFFQDSLSWYRNAYDGGVSKSALFTIKPKQNLLLSSSDKSNITISHITDANNAKVSFDILNSKDSYDTAVLHLLIPKWLWYNDYKDYNDSNTSDCSTHPCIEYKLLKNSSSSIKSGTFQGSDIGHEQNRTIKKVGVKVYR